MVGQLLAQTQPAGPGAMDILDRMQQFYTDAWNQLMGVLLIGFGVVGLIVPLLVQWMQSRSFKGERRRFERAIAEQRGAFDKKLAEQESSFRKAVEDVARLASRLERVEDASMSHILRAHVFACIAGSDLPAAAEMCRTTLDRDVAAKNYTGAAADAWILLQILGSTRTSTMSLGDREKCFGQIEAAMATLKGIPAQEWRGAANYGLLFETGMGIFRTIDPGASGHEPDDSAPRTTGKSQKDTEHTSPQP